MAIKYADGRMHHYPVDLMSMKVQKEFGTHRLLVEEDGDGCGFVAALVEFSSSEYTGGTLWSGKNLEVEIIFEVMASYDGVRHMYWTPGDDGYINYPALDELQMALEALAEIEEKRL